MTRSELIAALREAKGADRELGDAVMCHLVSIKDSDAKRFYGEGRDYTESLDAVVALVERVRPGWTIANIGQDDDKTWFAELREGYLTSYTRAVGSLKASTPAIALLIALLESHDEKPEGK